MSLALNDEALTLLFVGRLLVALDGVVVCCVLFGFIDGKGFIALGFLAFFLLAFLFAVFVSAVKLFRIRNERTLQDRRRHLPTKIVSTLTTTITTAMLKLCS